MEIIDVIMIHSFNHFDSAEAANKRGWWGLRPASLLKKRLAEETRFSCIFLEIFKNTFSTEHLWTTASDRGHEITRQKQ